MDGADEFVGRYERGQVIAGRYRLKGLVGEGGSGVVWAAEHLLTGKLVALKILKPSCDSPAWRSRFVREARAACTVRHPNVVAVHDVIEGGAGSPVLVMDLLEGETLRARLAREGALSVAATAEVLVPVVSAVGTAHARGVVHRDLKPENVFLTRDGGGRGVRVVDFGIAKLTATDGAPPAESLTATGSMVGTIYYMAPEQVYGERDIDHRADIWAIGVVLYECLAGRRPTEAANAGQIFKLITLGSIPRIHDVASGVPQDLADLVMDMLDRDVARRPQDLRRPLEIVGRYASTQAPSFPEPTAAPPTEPANEGKPAPASTETFDGVGLVASGTPSHAGSENTTTRRRPAFRAPRVFGLASLLMAALVGVIASFALRARPARTDGPILIEAAALSAPASVPLLASASIPMPPAMDAAYVAPLVPSPPLDQLALAPPSRVEPLTSVPRRAKSALDAGAMGAPSAATSPTTPQGIVETPPF